MDNQNTRGAVDTGGTSPMGESPKELQATHFMEVAMEHLKQCAKSRENSIAITQLETAMMFANKDATIKGYLKPYSTHVPVL